MIILTDKTTDSTSTEPPIEAPATTAPGFPDIRPLTQPLNKKVDKIIQTISFFMAHLFCASRKKSTASGNYEISPYNFKTCKAQ